jgi:periodic tryptophan protein 1
MIVAARTEDDVSHLEVYVFEENEDNLYVHHDVMLPSFPLCVEWLDFRAGRRAEEGGHGKY